MKKFDTLGFTRQTETLLHGIGGGGLINQFKERNISTNALHRLTKEDFVKLGAEEDHAKSMVDTLNISKKNTSSSEPKAYHEISDDIDILKIGEKQLNIIQMYLLYCKLKLQKKYINSFVEPDQALTASRLLCITADATLAEINEAELKLKELEAVIIPPVTQFIENKSKVYCILICGVCITMCNLLRKFNKI